MKQTVALFGAAEKGAFRKAHHLTQLPQLMDLFGNPPADTQGLFLAIQTILYNRDLIFFRVAEEGFGYPDYFQGLHLLQKHPAPLHALCLPGVGDPEILLAAHPILETHRALLITRPQDLQDFLTN